MLVDVAIDQGGCFETSRPTTHHDPTFEVDGVIHYCVANMPGAVPISSTYALTNATLPYVLALADHGIAEAARAIPGCGSASTSPAATSPTRRSPRESEWSTCRPRRRWDSGRRAARGRRRGRCGGYGRPRHPRRALSWIIRN